MAVAQGTVRVYEQGQTIAFRVEGQVRMAQSLPLRRLAEQRLAAGATTVRIDLRDCTYMDSTFLGTLLFLKSTTERLNQGHFALVLPSLSCRRLFEQMGLDAVFPVAEDLPEVPAWVDLTGGPADIQELKRSVTQAHQELARLDGPAAESFRAVIRCLEKSGDAGKVS